MHYTMLDQN